MKIIQNGIKKGVDNPDEYHWWLDRTFKCKNCMCLFSLERSDFPTKVVSSKPKLTGIECISVYCPYCAVLIVASKPTKKPYSIFKDIFGEGTFEKIFGKK